MSRRPELLTAAFLCAGLVGCQGEDFTPLLPVGSVEGYLCDPVGGGLAAGAAVTATGRDGELTVEADSSGFFRLDGVLAGDAVALTVVGASGAFETEVTVEILEGELTRLPEPPCLQAATGEVAGRICAVESQLGSGTGYYLANATVSIAVGADVYSTVSDAAGAFALAGVPAGNHTLEVTKGSFHASEPVVVLPSETTTLDDVCVEPTTQMLVLTGAFDSVEAILEGLGFGLRACNVPGIADAMSTPCPAAPDPAGQISLYDGEALDGGFFGELFLDGGLLPELVLSGPAAVQQHIVMFDCGLRDELFRPGQSDPAAAANLRAFVDAGGALYVSDFAYEVLRSYFPASGIDFYGDDATPEAAEVGQENRTYQATVTDPVLAQIVGSTVSIVYDAGAIDWVVLAPIQGPGVTVHVRADVEIDPDGDGVTETLAGAPLLVSVAWGEGRIAFTTFHNHDQSSAAMRDVLRYLVFEL